MGIQLVTGECDRRARSTVVSSGPVRHAGGVALCIGRPSPSHRYGKAFSRTHGLASPAEAVCYGLLGRVAAVVGLVLHSCVLRTIQFLRASASLSAHVTVLRSV